MRHQELGSPPEPQCQFLLWADPPHTDNHFEQEKEKAYFTRRMVQLLFELLLPMLAFCTGGGGLLGISGGPFFGLCHHPVVEDGLEKPDSTGLQVSPRTQQANLKK